MSSDATDGTGVTIRLSVANQTQDDELGHAKAILMSMLESHAENSAQVQKYRGELFYLLAE
jgi:hypothetical protein